MARTTALKAAGLDLLDRLYRNQVLVDLVFSDEERDALQGIATQARSMLEDAGLQGLHLERAIHYVVAGLEILAADAVHDIALSMGISLPPTLDDVNPKTVEQLERFSDDASFGLFLAIAEHAVGDRQLVIDVVNVLARDWGGVPATLRHRLCERVFAIEYPNAPVDILAWLARMEVVTPAKYVGRGAAEPGLDGVSIRATSLWELDTWRQAVQAGFRESDPTLPLRVVMNLDKAASHRALKRVWEATERMRKHASSSKGFRWLVLLQDRWQEKDYVQDALTNLSTFAPWMRVNVDKQSAAVSDIAAALMARAKQRDNAKPLFIEDPCRASHADDVVAVLNTRGFRMNPKTLYRRYKSSHQDHLRGLGGYYALLKRCDAVFPADNADVYQLYEVALTT